MAPERIPAIDRFMPKITVNPASGCWEWTGARKGNGYGNFSAGGVGSTVIAHRWSYEHFVGPIPEGLQIDHLCRNRRCVNPDHLEAVTCRTNLLRGETQTARRAAVTHCPQGHPYDAENTYIRPGGGRDCMECRRQVKRKKSA